MELAVKVSNKPLEPWQDDPWHVEAGCFWNCLALRLKESLHWSRARLVAATCTQVQPVWFINAHKLFNATQDAKNSSETCQIMLDHKVLFIVLIIFAFSTVTGFIFGANLCKYL